MTSETPQKTRWKPGRNPVFQGAGLPGFAGYTPPLKGGWWNPVKTRCQGAVGKSGANRLVAPTTPTLPTRLPGEGVGA